eukprot:c11511_g1_i1 orf=220-696(+)
MLPQPAVEDLASILQECRSRNRALVLRLHAYISRSGLEGNPSVGNDLVTAFVEMGAMRDAQQTFDRLLCKKEWSWSCLISGYMKCEQPQHALALYQDVQNVDMVCPSSPHTFVALIKACTKMKNLYTGLQIHAAVGRIKLLDQNLFIGSAFIDMYAKC